MFDEIACVLDSVESIEKKPNFFKRTFSERKPKKCKYKAEKMYAFFVSVILFYVGIILFLYDDC